MEPVAALPRRYTVEEYFALEAAAEERHVFYQGEVFALSGGIGFHNIVKQNCVAVKSANAASAS